MLLSSICAKFNQILRILTGFEAQVVHAFYRLILALPLLHSRQVYRRLSQARDPTFGKLSPRNWVQRQLLVSRLLFYGIFHAFLVVLVR